MDIVFLAVGRLKGPEQELCDRYLTRIGAMGRQLGIGKCSLGVIGEGRASTLKERQKQESEALLKKCMDKAVLIALDEHGKAFSSQKFSELIARIRDRGTPGLIFVLGGPDGHGEALLQRADFKLSLSPMTMPHGLARVVLAEQVYRAVTILGNHPYHRR
jgi:23S rRNA (pseudouridine1915-N3)-methyltransferase